jgi:PAS domain S-box-containing protein
MNAENATRPKSHADAAVPGAPRGRQSLFAHPLAWIVLVIALAATAGGWLVARKHDEFAAHKQFDEEAGRIQTALSERMSVYQNVLHGCAGLFAASASVERSEWKAYVDAVSVNKRFPGMDGLGFIASVPRDRLDDFLAVTRRDNATEFQIQNPGTNDSLFIVKYIEPEAELRSLLGLDFSTDPDRREVAEKARDFGYAVLSAKLTVRGRDSKLQDGLMMLMPVYRNGRPTETPEERRDSILGWVFARFVTAQLMSGILGDNARMLHFEIVDRTDPSAETIIFDSDSHDHTTTRKNYRSEFSSAESLAVGRRVWMLSSTTRPAFDATIPRSLERLVLAGGGLISILLFGIVASLSSTRARAMAMAEKMTEAFRKTTADLQAQIAERRRSEEALEHERYLLKMLMDTVPDRIYFKDLQSRFLRNSQAHLQRFGLTKPEQAIGKTDFDFFTEEHAREAYEDEQRVIELGQPITKEEKETWPDGSITWAWSTKMPMRDESGKIVGTFGISRDITARRRAEEALREAKEAAEEASRAKSQFLASMSHELRTPLNSVIGFANILLKNKNGNLTAAELTFLDRIVANGKHLLTLINEILDLSKIEARKVELQIAPVALDTLVRETISQQESLVRDRPVQLLADLPEKIAAFPTDAEKLRQVIINLIGNALKFTEHGSVTVRVVTDPDDHHPLRIDVVDTGIGIPREKLGLIFEAFQQAEAGTARKYGGTGLGLTISQALCQLMGYHIEVASEVGKGSTFSVILKPTPELQAGVAAVSAPKQIALPETAAHVALQGRRVLVIDDEADSRTLLSHAIGECGCQVIAASSGVQGLQMAREFRPDLITLDLMMPSMDGWQVVRAIKSDPELSHIPVVVVSIVANENRGHLFGAVDVLQKPVSREDLLEVLQRNMVVATPRILIVDDDADAREIMAACLQDKAVEFRTANNGQDALALLPNFLPDLILLDLMMPVMDGITFLDIIRRDARYQRLPVIVITAKELTPAETERLKAEKLCVLNKADAFDGHLKHLLEELLRTTAPQPAAALK